MGRPPKCACQCNYVLYSSSIGSIDDSGNATVRFQSCDLSRKKSGHDAAWCTDIDDKGFEYHCNSNVNSFPVYAKRNKDGETIWEYIGTEGHFDEQFACVDNQYNVYGVGQDFGGGSEVIKLNSEGVEQWKNNYADDAGGISGFGSITNLNFHRIACDTNGNCIATGSAGGHLGIGLGSGIVAKFDSDGNLLWYVVASDLSGTYGTGAGEISASNFGTAQIQNNGDFYVSLGASHNSASPDNLFKLDSDGNLIWKTAIGVEPLYQDYGGPNICLDRDENLYVEWSDTDTVEYLSKYVGGDTSQAAAWTTEIEGVASGGGQLARVLGIASNGKIPACIYLTVNLGTGPAVEDRNKAERYNGDDGTREERVGLLTFTDSVVASPGRHPNFF